jgi:PhnB protein
VNGSRFASIASNGDRTPNPALLSYAQAYTARHGRQKESEAEVREESRAQGREEIGEKDGLQALEFYGKAFGAKEKGRLVMPDGKLAHGELEIAGARVMLSEEVVDWGNHSPRALGGTPVSITIYVRNADALFERAIKAGARSERPMADQFYGDRMGTLVDPFGHRWSIATHKEDVTFREMQKRMDRMFQEDS